MGPSTSVSGWGTTHDSIEFYHRVWPEKLWMSTGKSLTGKDFGLF